MLNYAIWVWIRMRCDPCATMVVTARLSRLRLRRRDFSVQGGDGETFQTKAETARFSGLRWRRLNFPDQGRHGVYTLMAKVAPHPPRWRRISSWWRRLRLGLWSHAVSTLVLKVAPHLPRLRVMNSSRAISASVWKVATSPPWSGKSRRLRLGLESSAVSIFVASKWFLVAPSPP